MVWGVPGFAGREGGGKLYKEKAKLLFPPHFLHLHHRQDVEVIFSSMSTERVMGEEEILPALCMPKQQTRISHRMVISHTPLLF